MIRLLQFHLLFFTVLMATAEHILSSTTTSCATDPPLDLSSRPPASNADPMNGYQQWATSSAASSYQNFVYIPKKSDPCDGMAFHWKTISSDKLKVAVAVQATGWSAIGFSETGGMKGADIVYYEANTNKLVDAYVKDGYVKPTEDDVQDWTLIDSKKTNDGFLIFEAERALVTGDTVHDRDIMDDSGPLVADHRLIGAWGNGERIGYHSDNRINTFVQLFPGDEGSGNAYETFQAQMAKLSEGSVTLALDNYEIPSDEVTTYHDACFSTKDLVATGLLENSSSDTHILGFEFHIDKDSLKYVHHIVVYGHIMEINQDENEDACIPWSKVPAMTWAPGDDFYYFPEGGGLQVGNVPGSFNAFTIEYHFDNIDRDENIIDNGSGVQLFYTNQPVEMEIGMIAVGDPSVNLIGEPVGNGKTMHTFTCSSSCSGQSFQDDEVTIIYEGHHMHQVGKRMTNELFRGDTLVNRAVVDFWDFDQNGVSQVQQQPYKMKKGDYYRTTCYYESDDEDTKFGLESQDEMCMTFLYYYPKQPFFYGCGYNNYGEVCGADYTYAALRSGSTFGRFGTSPGVLDVDDKVSSGIGIQRGVSVGMTILAVVISLILLS